MAASGVEPYHSSPPKPSLTITTSNATQVPPNPEVRPAAIQVPPTVDQVAQPKFKRVKQTVISKKAPYNIIKKRGVPSRKRKTTGSSVAVQHSTSSSQDSPVNIDETNNESSVLGDVFKRKKLKLTQVKAKCAPRLIS